MTQTFSDMVKPLISGYYLGVSVSLDPWAVISILDGNRKTLLVQ